MKQGFTLSEVLITLGIVGIVAVLTIPGVMKNYKNRLYTAQLEKVYSQISDATQAIMADEHVDNFYETTAASATTYKDGATDNQEPQTGVGYFLTKYFKAVKKDCFKADKSGCMTSNANTYKTIGNASITSNASNYCIQTVSGAAICGSYNAKVASSGEPCMSLVIDVNGMAAPNVAGRDVFSLDVYKNGSILDYNTGCQITNADRASLCTTGATSSLYSAANGCLVNVMEAGWKMEY